jgi:hypothetical protein
MTAAPKPSKKPQSTVTVATKGKGTTAPQNAPKKIGAPKGSGSKYTEEIADKICDLVSNGVNLRSVCRIQGMPAWRTVYDWVVARPEFAARLARARELGYDALAEEALEISNTPVMGQKQVMGDSKTYTTVEDMLGHRKLQIETRLKLLACWDPKKYGNRTTLAGDAQNPVVIDAAREAKDLLEALLLNVELNKQAKINS